MGNHKGGAVFREDGDRVLDAFFGHSVDGGGCLIEDEDRGICEERACEAKELLLTGGQEVAAFADITVEAVSHTFYDGIGRDEAECFPNLVIGGIRFSVAEVLTDCPGKKVRCLQHIADMAVQPELGPLPCISPVDQHLPLCRLKKAADEVHKCRLPGAGLTDDGNRSSLRHDEVKVLKHHLLPIRIMKRHVPKLDITKKRLPVLPLRMEHVTVFFDNRGTILHIRLSMQKLAHPFNVYLYVQHRRNGLQNKLDRIHHLQCIRHEDGQCTDFHHTLHRQLSTHIKHK